MFKVMETREEILKVIKEQMPQWTDEQCLAYLEQQERMDGEVETVQRWVAYYKWNDSRRYGIMTEEEFDKKKMESKVYECRYAVNKKAAEDQIRDWKAFYN
jgi:hypothetical protein